MKMCTSFLFCSFLVFVLSLVSWLLGFLVSWFRSFEFQSFNISLKLCWKVLIPCYHNSISCFLEDIDPIFKIFKNLLDGSSGLFGPRLFHCPFQSFDFHLLNFQKYYFWQLLFSHIIYGILVPPKMNNIGLGSHGHVRKSPKPGNKEFSSSPILKSESN